jgi:DNA repair photolyase
MSYSMNPYAGCEHGCIYCYARNVHEYWGYSAGLDFERKIIVKKNAPQLLRKFLMHPKWDATPIMLSGNTGLLSTGRTNIQAHKKNAGSMQRV